MSVPDPVRLGAVEVDVVSIDAGVVAANRAQTWRIDVVDFVSGVPCRFVLQWADLHAATRWDWTGPTVPAAQQWAAARGLLDPEQAMLNAVTDTQR